MQKTRHESDRTGISGWQALARYIFFQYNRDLWSHFCKVNSMGKNIFEKNLDDIEADYPKHFTCEKCGETKEAHLFRYIVSRDYAESMGYRYHLERPMKRMSPLCDVCNPDYVTPTKMHGMTRGELERHLIDGRIDRRAFDHEMYRRKNNPLLDPVHKTRSEQMWLKHAERWKWLRAKLLADHRRARTDVYRHEVELKPMPPNLYALASMLVDYTALLMRRVTECKRARLSSTEGIPTLAQMLGERRTHELRKAWERCGADFTPHRYGRQRVVPFLVRNLDNPALENAPDFRTIRTKADTAQKEEEN